MLGDVNKLFVFKTLLIMTSNVLSLHLKQTFPPIIRIFTEGKGDEIESRLPFKIFFTLPLNKLPWNDKRGRMAKSVTCPLLQNHPSKYSRFQKDHLLWICEWEVSSMRILANDGAYDVCKIKFNSSEFLAVIIRAGDKIARF